MMEGKDGGVCHVLECDELTSDVRNLILLIVLIVFLSSVLPNLCTCPWNGKLTESVKRRLCRVYSRLHRTSPVMIVIGF